MATLPQPTIDAIYAAYERRADRRHSNRLGASVLGEECDRRLWLGFRHAAREQVGGRILRLFDTGHREELRIIEDLRAIGCEVYDRDPATGEQYTFTGLDGHLVAKLDGVVTGLPEAPETPHALSCKSANKKNFDKIEKDGIEKAKPVYFAQSQIEMGLADLTRAAVVVVCKDDDRIYLERIHYSDKTFKALLLRAKRIISSEGAPERIGGPDNFVCKFCPFAKLCHGEQLPEVNCRTCVHSSAAANGQWSCGRDLEMRPDCAEHIYLPDLLDAWAEPLDGDPTFVKYRVRSTKREFINVAATGFPAMDEAHYSSAELQHCKVPAIGEPAVEAARSLLDGKVVA
jgi:hypothetical protein